MADVERWPVTDAMAAINRRRDAIHVAAVLYYHYDWSLYPDSFYDKLSSELVELHKLHPELVTQGYEWEAFQNWNGTAGGFQLPLTDRVIRSAMYHMAHHTEASNKSR